MTSAQYIGIDVLTQSISIAVRNSLGKVTMECVIGTKANTILQFMDGLRGDLRVAFEVARHTARWAALFLVLAKQAETIFVGGALMFRRTGVGHHLPITGPWASSPPSQLEVHHS